MNRVEAKATADAMPRLSPQEAFRAGLALLDADYPELLLAPAQLQSNRHRADPRMAQLLGLAARANGDGPLAYTAFRRAAALAPADPLIAHSHARTALEAGHPAAALFEAARSLAPNDGSAIQGHAAALVAEGEEATADMMLAAILVTNPLWLDGHATLAQIRSQHGGDPLASLSAALAVHPDNSDLHRLAISTLLKTRQTVAARAAIAVASEVLGSQDWLAWYRGHAASELGEIGLADTAFAAAPPPRTPAEVALLARHTIKANRPQHCAELIEPWLDRQPEGELWPYAALAWRMIDDRRAQWLEGEPSLVGVYDLAERIGDLSALAASLRVLHTAKEAPLDQSVRGGTQTDGNLLLRDEPAIQNLRRVLLDTVAVHVAQLPPPGPNHPTLIARRDPLRIAGSWSVRLSGAGYHSDHVHTQGWLSSAFYVALPDAMAAGSDGAEKPGWLSLGECRDLAPELAPHSLIEPKPGRLVLFPSSMWHGTRPYSAGERLTVAFDIARPKQD